MRRTAFCVAVLCGLVCACQERDQRPASQPSRPMAMKQKAAVEEPAAAPAPAIALAPAPVPAAAAVAPPQGKPSQPASAPSGAMAPLGGAKAGKAQGVGGLGLRGVGSGGGGEGKASGHGNGAGASISVGSIGTVGRGSGASASYGAGGGSGGRAYGMGSGSLNGREAGVVAGAVTAGQKGMTRAEAAGAEKMDPTSENAFRDYGVNPFTVAAEDRLSTFAADVDTASYAIARRQILSGTLPAAESVRVEEFLNYFGYAYAPPEDDRPFLVSMDAAPSPFTPGRALLRVGVRARMLKRHERKPLHLTFLVDVSGSMQSPDRLPLAKRALRILVDTLRDGDTVSLVTYAGTVKDVLPPTGIEKGKGQIYSAIEDLTAGGSTAMASGLDLAYRNAMKGLDGDSVSRVLVLTDGDANVGASGHEEILRQIQKYVKEGVTLTTVGFGMGNLKDETLEQLANKGNGNYYYVDSLMQARRVFHEQMGSTLELLAQDVKLQVEFDPAKVKRYRLVGYENRAIADRDFRNDRVDAGEVGSGHTVTALYELETVPDAPRDGLATVRIRAKKPRGEKADEWTFGFPASAWSAKFDEADPQFRFAAVVMGVAEKLRRSKHAEGWDYDQMLRIARAAAPSYCAERQEFLALMEKARPLVGAVAARK